MNLSRAQIRWLHVLAHGGVDVRDVNGRVIPIATERALLKRGLVRLVGRWVGTRADSHVMIRVELTDAGLAAINDNSCASNRIRAVCGAATFLDPSLDGRDRA